LRRVRLLGDRGQQCDPYGDWRLTEGHGIYSALVSHFLQAIYIHAAHNPQAGWNISYSKTFRHSVAGIFEYGISILNLRETPRKLQQTDKMLAAPATTLSPDGNKLWHGQGIFLPACESWLGFELMIDILLWILDCHIFQDNNLSREL
jgi:hypothetical protein